MKQLQCVSFLRGASSMNLPLGETWLVSRRVQVLETERQALEHDRAELLVERAKSCWLSE